MAGQEMETGHVTWRSVPVAASSSLYGRNQQEAAGDSEKSMPNRLHNALSPPTAFRSVQQGFGRVSSAPVRFYRRTWSKVSSASARLHLRVCTEKTTAMVLPSSEQTCLVTALVALRLLQMASAHYVFVCVTESFRSKIAFHGRLGQIQPLILATVVLSVVAFVFSFVLTADRIRRTVVSRVITAVSLPLDLSMICLFVAQNAMFGVHSFECAALRGVGRAVEQYDYLQNITTLELRTQDVCLVPSSVYLVCIVVAFSYFASVTVTIRQLLGDRKSLSSIASGQCRYSDHVEHAVRVTVSPLGPASSVHALPQFMPSPDSEEPKYANLPVDLLERVALARPRTPPPRSSSVPPRTSHETTFSTDPDHYTVSDGFRPHSRPPSFTSSRDSSEGPPEYRSRPPSLHTVVLRA